jgi:hypothetical protein
MDEEIRSRLIKAILELNPHLDEAYVRTWDNETLRSYIKNWIRFKGLYKRYW